MTSQEAITKIIAAGIADDLVAAEKALDEYFQERKRQELLSGMERIDRGGYFSLERNYFSSNKNQNT